MSSFEVRRYFTLSGDDRHVLRRRFRSRSRLGAALQLGFVRMTGATLDAYFAHRAGYSYAEIAEHLKISQRAVKRHIVRGLMAIMERGDL
jgi:DNA-binding MarR family transcriptional regulator